MSLWISPAIGDRKKASAANGEESKLDRLGDGWNSEIP